MGIFVKTFYRIFPYLEKADKKADKIIDDAKRIFKIGSDIVDYIENNKDKILDEIGDAAKNTIKSSFSGLEKNVNDAFYRIKDDFKSKYQGSSAAHSQTSNSQNASSPGATAQSQTIREKKYNSAIAHACGADSQIINDYMSGKSYSDIKRNLANRADGMGISDSTIRRIMKKYQAQTGLYVPKGRARIKLKQTANCAAYDSLAREPKNKSSGDSNIAGSMGFCYAR